MSKLRNTIFSSFFIIAIILTGVVSSVHAAAFAPAVSLPAGTGPSSIAAAFFDGDLNSDVAVANFRDNTVSVMLGNGDGTFTAAAGSPIDVGTAPYAVISRDFDRDGNIDLAVANSGDDTVSILLGNGDGTFTPATGSPFAVGTTPYSLTSSDLDGDGFIDLAVANHKSGSISILVGDGTGFFAPTSPALFSAGSSPAAIVAADFNTDEVEVKDELAVADSKNHNITILSLKNTLGTYTMTTAKKYSVGRTPLSLVTGDFNGDGLPDLAVANANSKNISVLLGLGTNLMTNPVHYKVIAFPSSITEADLDGDGRLDLAVTHLKGSMLSVLYGGGNGTFLQPITFPVGNHPLAVAAGDFNTDGNNDLLTANYNANTLSLLINTPTANISVTSPAAGEHIATGSPYLITWAAFPGAVSRYVINYSSNNGRSFKKLAEVANLQTTYSWNVPIPTANLNDNIIKIVAYDASNTILAEGSSKATFSIDAVAITQPNGGETFIGGQTKTISWNTYATTKPATSVNLYYSVDGGSKWKQITSITGNQNPGTYAYTTWTVPTVTADEHDALVKIELRAGSKIVASDISDKFFTITVTP